MGNAEWAILKYLYVPNIHFMFSEPIEHNEPYDLEPVKLEGTTDPDYIQPWSGYVPVCEHHNSKECEEHPIQKANIKKEWIYRAIEVQGNKWVGMACELASESIDRKGGPFGAVVIQVDDETGNIIRYWKSHNRVTQDNDPTAHAEVMAIRSACHSLGLFSLSEITREASKLPQEGRTSHCEVFCSTEPCPMCFSAIFWARIPVVWFAATRFDADQPGLDFSDADLYRELAKPYPDRQTRVYQCEVHNSLDAFNLWKRTSKINY